MTIPLVLIQTQREHLEFTKAANIFYYKLRALRVLISFKVFAEQTFPINSDSRYRGVYSRQDAKFGIGLPLQPLRLGTRYSYLQPALLLELNDHSARPELQSCTLRSRTQDHDHTILVAHRYATHAPGERETGFTSHIISFELRRVR